MAETDLHRTRARDGRDLPVWVTRASGPKQARPAVVLVHGGPWVRGRHWGWQGLPQFLASRGYVVIEPEFRGSAGYGLPIRPCDPVDEKIDALRAELATLRAELEALRRPPAG
jgi:dipeptidyl aminopeptidase/acylaminoacyl peptidase